MSSYAFGLELFIALRNITFHRRQTLLSVTAVALAVSISLVFTSLGNGSQELLTGIVEDKLPHVKIYPEGDEKYINLYRGLLDRIATIEGIRSYSATISSQATISFKEKRKNALLRGVDPFREDEIYRISDSIVRGDFFSIRGINNVVMGFKLAEKLNLKVGDSMQASFPRANNISLKLVGIFDSGTPLDESLAYVSSKTVRNFLNEGDVINSVELKLRDIYHAQKVADFIDGLGYNAMSWQESNPEILRSINVGGFWRSLSIFFVMIIAAFGIAAIMNILVMEKIREIGMLLALGAGRYSLLKIFIYQSGILGIFGGILGCILGFLAIMVLGNLKFEISAAGRDLSSIPLVIDAWNFPSYVLLALGLSVLAGAYPAYKASRLNPVDALKGSEEGGNKRRRWKPTFLEEKLACQCLSLGFEMAVAARHILSNRRGTAFTLLSVGVAVGVIIMSLGITEGVRIAIVENTVEKNPHLYVEPEQDEDYLHFYRTLSEKIWDYPGVVAVSPRLIGQGAARYKENVEAVEFIGVDPPQEYGIMELQASIKSGDFFDLRYGRNCAFLGTKLAENLEVRPGKRFDLVQKERLIKLRVAGLVEKGTAKDYNLVYLPLKTAQNLVEQGDVVTEIAVKLSDFEEAPEAAETLGYRLNKETSSWQEFNREIARFISTQSRINLIFFSMILLISGFVIANTTIMIISRRTKEIGIMMAMGASRRSILKIFLTESLLLALPGGILGSMVGLAVGRMIAAFGPSGFGGVALTFNLRPELIAYSILFAIVLNFLAGLYPAIKASELDPVDAIAL
ncbi:MAG: outer membrane-specific lipoprotein transporter subunit LolE [Methanosaeta sp. PtaU1.Bin112]|nr:MAG: outer membrane-specific lipoprotein transporter subunit LolE [Methanosaeta sp. PtaU1.Bin112]